MFLSLLKIYSKMFQKVKIFAKPDTISFVLSEDASYFVIFDYEGRLNFILKDVRSYRRSFDNTFLCGDLYSSRFRFLSDEEGNSVFIELYSLIKGIIVSGDFEIYYTGGKQNDVLEVFEKISNFDYTYFLEDALRFRSVYKPITVLPPDQYLSLYIPLTEGCSYNKCSFCNLYRDRKFRIKDEDEVVLMVKGILDYFRKSLLTRKGVFLGEGNVFVENTYKIVNAIKRIKDLLRESEYIKFDIDNCFYGFMDTFHTRKTKEEMRLLKESGVRRVYIGLETGDDFLLSNVLLKPSSSKDVLNAVRSIKEVGMNVGIIVIVGVGGKKYKDVHFNKTVSLISSMGLTEGDIVYLSPIVEYENLLYKDIMDKNGIERLSEDEMRNEIFRFKKSLSLIQGVKVPIYRVDRFLYA